MLQSLREWCDAHHVLLIFDEVLTGFGRNGPVVRLRTRGRSSRFSCLAKGLTGGYLPLAATLSTERIYEAFLGDYHELKTFFYGHSYCGNPLGRAAAPASLQIFEEQDILKTLAGKISLLTELLSDLRALANVRDVRQCGYIAGIEVKTARANLSPGTSRRGPASASRRGNTGCSPERSSTRLCSFRHCAQRDGQLQRAIDAIRRAIREVCRSGRKD